MIYIAHFSAHWTLAMNPLLDIAPLALLNIGRLVVDGHWSFFIIIKTSSTVPSEKNKVVYKLLSQPHRHLRHGKLKKTQLREATTAPLNPSRVPESNTV